MVEKISFSTYGEPPFSFKLSFPPFNKIEFYRGNSRVIITFSHKYFSPPSFFKELCCGNPSLITMSYFVGKDAVFFPPEWSFGFCTASPNMVWMFPPSFVVEESQAFDTNGEWII